MSTENWQLITDVFTRVINMDDDFDFDLLLSHLQAHNQIGVEDGLKSAEASIKLMKTLIVAIVIYYLKLRGVLDPEFLDDARQNMRVYATRNRTNSQEAFLCRRTFGFLESLDMQYGKEIRLRIIAKGSPDDEDSDEDSETDEHLDTVEYLVLNIEYGNEPLLKVSSDGSFCKVQLNEAKTELRSSISELFEAIRDMAEDLPRLNRFNQPIVYLSMKKTEWAPKGYVAPYYPDYIFLTRPALRDPSPCLRSWIMYDEYIHEKLKAHSGVNTGFHLLKTTLIHRQGHFTSSDLFIKSYADAAARSLRY